MSEIKKPLKIAAAQLIVFIVGVIVAVMIILKEIKKI